MEDLGAHFKEVFEDPRFKAQPLHVQNEVALNFFKEHVEPNVAKENLLNARHAFFSDIFTPKAPADEQAMNDLLPSTGAKLAVPIAMLRSGVAKQLAGGAAEGATLGAVKPGAEDLRTVPQALARGVGEFAALDLPFGAAEKIMPAAVGRVASAAGEAAAARGVPPALAAMLPPAIRNAAPGAAVGAAAPVAETHGHATPGQMASSAAGMGLLGAAAGGGAGYLEGSAAEAARLKAAAAEAEAAARAQEAAARERLKPAFQRPDADRGLLMSQANLNATRADALADVAARDKSAAEQAAAQAKDNRDPRQVIMPQMQKAARSLNEQQQALEQFIKRNSYNYSEGVKKEFAARSASIEKARMELEDLRRAAGVVPENAPTETQRPEPAQVPFDKQAAVKDAEKQLADAELANTKRTMGIKPPPVAPAPAPTAAQPVPVPAPTEDRSKSERKPGGSWLPANSPDWLKRYENQARSMPVGEAAQREMVQDTATDAERLNEFVGGRPITKDQLVREAAQNGSTRQEILQQSKENGLSPAQWLSFRQSMVATRNRITELAQQAQSLTGDAQRAAELELNAERDTMRQFNEQFVKERASTARKMLIERWMMERAMSPEERFTSQLASRLGDRLTGEQITQLQELYAKDPLAAHKAALEMYPTTRGEKLMGYYVGNMLSSPVTGERILLDNGANLALDIPVKGAAAAIDAGRALVTGSKQQRFVAAETVSRMAGYMEGAPKGARAAMQTLITGVSPRDIEDLNINPNQKPATTPLGKVADFSKRMVTAAHLLPRMMAEEGELHTQAMNAALRDLQDGAITKEQVGERAAFYRRTPSEEMLEASRGQGVRSAYQEKLGQFSSGVKLAANLDMGKLHPSLSGIKPGRLLVPFYNIAINRGKQALEWTPLGIARMTGETVGRKEDVAARMVLGGGLSLVMAQKALKGEMWGAGPVSAKPDEYQRWLMQHHGIRDGIQLGDHIYSFDHFGNIAPALRMLANATDQWKFNHQKLAEARASGKSQAEIADLSSHDAAKIAYAMGKAFTDESYLRTLSMLLEVPQQAGSKVNTAAAAVGAPVIEGAIPASGLMRTVAHATDNVVRDTASKESTSKRITDRIKSDLPGISKALPPKLDPVGRVVERPGGVLQPVHHAPAGDAYGDYLEKMGVTVPTPQRKLGGIPFDDKTFHAYMAERGAAVRQVLDMYKQAGVSDPSMAPVLKQAVSGALAQVNAKYTTLLTLKNLGARP